MNLKKTFTIIIILIYLLVPFLFSQNTTGIMHHYDAGISECPYMDGGQSLCPFDLGYYLNIWKSIFIASVTNSRLLLYFFAVVITLFSLSIIISDKLIFYIKSKIESKIKILYQELFSNGILNPKVF